MLKNKIKVGVSSCLLGNIVRYDGAHSFNKYIINNLGKFFNYIKICPEVECGFKVPREPMHLTGKAKNPRIVTSITNIDYTDKMTFWIEKEIKNLEKQNLYGFIFKSKSPSSGISGVKLYDSNGFLKGKTLGLFAKAFIKNFPSIPFEEDYRLSNKRIRKKFIKKVFLYLENNK